MFFSSKQGQALRVSWKNHPRPVGLSVFFHTTLPDENTTF
ncbi:hypothetical protein BACDOR_01835 [Phocaeicola dorei DSM 17855]|uniref:Uncharacterized protein n=1 Tax=Phocaeicola dorei DSM 17855 TaxID=483217 RepID=B6VWW1_9BACT|nr:hypothetical protein BACDOR_01835 [Phocaeicola dorei DSM 17855]DAQ76386.1 MAG TPA: hypothetical protein [Caudoviricetes sp.]DAV24791.1 MAG TPA: hypothetical protein [Caudoviricetes sp.]